MSTSEAKVHNQPCISLKTQSTSDKRDSAKYLYTVEHKTMREIAPLLGVSHQTIRVMRSRLRPRNYCNAECYHAVRQQRPYTQWRQGQRIARATVSKYYDLAPENVVHHEDGDNSNNANANLKVFANQSDHMAYHHGKPIQPLWDGSHAINPHASPISPSHANQTPEKGIAE